MAQHDVTNNIELAKAKWSAFQAKRIHKMRFTPKDALKEVNILVGGKESHYIKPVVMRLNLPNSNLASIDEQNTSVMTPHFEKAYTNHQPVTWEVTNDIDHRDNVLDIDHTIEWK